MAFCVIHIATHVVEAVVNLNAVYRNAYLNQSAHPSCGFILTSKAFVRETVLQDQFLDCWIKAEAEEKDPASLTLNNLHQFAHFHARIYARARSNNTLPA